MIKEMDPGKYPAGRSPIERDVGGFQIRRFSAGYFQLMEEHGVNPYGWPAGARLQWQRENSLVSWPGGGYSPNDRGEVPS